MTAASRESLPQQTVVTPAEDAARRARFPVGASLELADLEDAGREDVLDRLRDAEPVSWARPCAGCSRCPDSAWWAATSLGLCVPPPRDARARVGLHGVRVCVLVVDEPRRPREARALVGERP